MTAPVHAAAGAGGGRVLRAPAAPAANYGSDDGVPGASLALACFPRTAGSTASAAPRPLFCIAPPAWHPHPDGARPRLAPDVLESGGGAGHGRTLPLPRLMPLWLWGSGLWQRPAHRSMPAPICPRALGATLSWQVAVLHGAPRAARTWRTWRRCGRAGRAGGRAGRAGGKAWGAHREGKCSQQQHTRYTAGLPCHAAGHELPRASTQPPYPVLQADAAPCAPGAEKPP